MIVIVVIITILLSMAVFHILYLKKCIRIAREELQAKVDESANGLLTTRTDNKEICALLQEINSWLVKSREEKLQIEVKNRDLQRTIVNISHDLRTPLTSAIGYLELIQNYDVPADKEAEYHDKIQSKLQDLSYLVEDFFAFTKMIYDEKDIEITDIDSNQILEESIVNYYPEFMAQQRKIHIQGNKKTILPSNGRMLRRIFDNIIGNALKHSQSDVYIDIEMGEMICYTFTNQVSEKIEVERIFEEFYTSDISRTKQDTGLGLAIVKEFSERLHGQVKAKQVNNELRIIVSFPLIRK